MIFMMSNHFYYGEHTLFTVVFPPAQLNRFPILCESQRFGTYTLLWNLRFWICDEGYEDCGGDRNNSE